jgi:hypothetical protein
MHLSCNVLSVGGASSVVSKKKFAAVAESSRNRLSNIPDRAGKGKAGVGLALAAGNWRFCAVPAAGSFGLRVKAHHHCELVQIRPR